MILLKLFTAFARVGVLTFGGGYAMIPMLEREIVDRHGWATSEELMDYYVRRGSMHPRRNCRQYGDLHRL